MKSSLTPDEIREAKTVFTSYMEFLDREKEMKEEKKAIKEQLVQLLEAKASDVTKILNYLQKRWEGDSSIDDAYAMAELIAGPRISEEW